MHKYIYTHTYSALLDWSLYCVDRLFHFFVIWVCEGTTGG